MKKITDLIETNYIHISGADGLPLRVVRIEPAEPSEIKGIVQIVHGKNEHKGRYKDFMRYLASNGYLAIANDHRGHGESVWSPDDHGYMYEGGFKALVEDIHEITLEVKKYAEEKCGRSDLSFVMLAHSMGTLAARCYIRKYDYELDKLCLTGCPTKSGKMASGLRMLKALELILGKKSRSKIANLFIMWLPYEFRYRKEGMRNAWTNSDREAVKEQNNDPLCNYRFTVGGYEQMIRMAMLAYSKGYTPKNPDMPIRFLSGADDPCAKSRRKLAKAAMLLKEIGYTDVRFKMYKGLRHDILREKKKHRVYADVLAFVETNPV